MKLISTKLKGKRGASIVLALMLFLICAVVGGLVLTVASANAGRLSHMRREQQAYLSVSSAAKVFASELSNQGFSATIVSNDGSVSDAVYDNAEGVFGELLTAYATSICSDPLHSGWTENLSIESNLDTVNAAFSMADDYSITVDFTLDAKNLYKITLKIPANVSECSIVESWEETDPSTNAISVHTRISDVTKITWVIGTITKGAS